MHVFLDENVDPRLKDHLPDLSVTSIFDTSWKGLKNGQLMLNVSVDFNVFVTRDAGLPHQQNLSKFGLGVVVIKTKTTFFDDLIVLAPQIAAACRGVKAGQAIVVTG